jgi:hypothetical protein
MTRTVRTAEQVKAEWATAWEGMKEFNADSPNPELVAFVENMFLTETDAFWATNARHNARLEKFLSESHTALNGDWI